MATGYHFSTNADGKLQAQHVVDDVANRTDIIPFGCWVQNVDGTNITISNGGSVMMSFPASAVLTVESVAAEADINDLVIQLGAVFPDASSGGGAINFTEMVDETWYWATKSEAITIIADVDITTVGSPSPGKCIMFIQDGTGGHVPTLNGDDSFADINTAANAVTIFCLIERENGDFGVIVDTSYVPITIPTPDVTAPTATYEAIDAHTIVETFDEDTTGDGVGIAFSNGAPLTINSATRNSATEIEYDIDEEMTDADTIVFERASSDIEDLAGNPLADDTGSVTNSIPPAGGFPTGDIIGDYRSTVFDGSGSLASWANSYAGGGAMPTLNASGAAPADQGALGAYFNGTSSNLDTEPVSGGFAFPAQWTINILMRTNAATAELFCTGGIGSAPNYGVAISGTSTDLGFSKGTPPSISTTVVSAMGALEWFTITFNGTLFEMFRGTTQFATFSVSGVPGNPVPSPANSFTFYQLTQAGGMLDGWVKALIVHNTAHAAGTIDAGYISGATTHSES